MGIPFANMSKAQAILIAAFKEAAAITGAKRITCKWNTAKSQLESDYKEPDPSCEHRNRHNIYTSGFRHLGTFCERCGVAVGGDGAG